ncbi:MAG: GNAT family N-acetyltransferase [Ilumatobacteraceae bacterium]
MSDEIDIRVLDDPAEMQQLMVLLGQIWGSHAPLVGVELLRAIEHAGGYVAAAHVGGQLVGGSMGFLGRHDGAPSLHSHVTGVLPGVRRTGLGRAMKLHQRAWAAEHGLTWITWTFDPLVRRNARFNIDVLGAEVHEYLVDFYGPMDDAINSGDESDRLLVAWSTDPSATTEARPSAPPTGGVTAVATPEDIVVLRRTDPSGAATWRHRVRTELGDALHAGARVVGFTRTGEYLLDIGP